MSNNFEAVINDSAPSKSGKRTNRTRDDFSKSLKKSFASELRRDASIGKKYFVGIVLRIELRLEESLRQTYEPGSLMAKKYSNQTSAPAIVAIKARIPELHSMLPIPSSIGSDDCDKKRESNLGDCHHPVIDLYPTFYGRNDNIPVPKPGDLVRLSFKNLETMTDPIYVGVEKKSGFLSIANYGALKPPPEHIGDVGCITKTGKGIPPATCGAYDPVRLVVKNDDIKENIFGAPCDKNNIGSVNWMGKTISFHKAAIPALKMVETDISRCKEGVGYNWWLKNEDGTDQLPEGGTYNCRCIKKPNVDPGKFPDCTIGVSNHSWATAIDINPNQNPYKEELIYDIPACAIAAFKRYGFSWGGDWKGKKDSMHFEFLGDPIEAKESLDAKKYFNEYKGDPYCKGRPDGTGPSGPIGCRRGGKKSITSGKDTFKITKKCAYMSDLYENWKIISPVWPPTDAAPLKLRKGRSGKISKRTIGSAGPKGLYLRPPALKSIGMDCESITAGRIGASKSLQVQKVFWDGPQGVKDKILQEHGIENAQAGLSTSDSRGNWHQVIRIGNGSDSLQWMIETAVHSKKGSTGATGKYLAVEIYWDYDYNQPVIERWKKKYQEKLNKGDIASSEDGSSADAASIKAETAKVKTDSTSYSSPESNRSTEP